MTFCGLVIYRLFSRSYIQVYLVLSSDAELTGLSGNCLKIFFVLQIVVELILCLLTQSRKLMDHFIDFWVTLEALGDDPRSIGHTSNEFKWGDTLDYAV